MPITKAVIFRGDRSNRKFHEIPHRPRNFVSCRELPRFLLILVFGQSGTDVKAHLVTDELTYLADCMDMSASEGLLHQPCVEALRKGCEKLRNYMRDDGSDTTRFRACRAFDVAKLNIGGLLNVTHEFICENIPWFEDDIQAKTEL